MSAGRRSSRRQAVFVLYQEDLLGLARKEAPSRPSEEELSDYARRILDGVARQQQHIDQLLAAQICGWDLYRLGVLERAILRAATYELIEETDVPVAVVVDEAVNLAKRFCSAEAGALVNGVLGGLAGAVRQGVSDHGPEKEHPG